MRMSNEPILRSATIIALLGATVYTCSVGLKDFEEQERAESARRDRQSSIDALRGSDIDTPYLAWAPPQFDGATMGVTAILARDPDPNGTGLSVFAREERGGLASINHILMPRECPRCHARCGNGEGPSSTIQFIGPSTTTVDADGRAIGTAVAWWTCGSCESSTLVYWPEPQSPYFVMEKP